MGQGYSTALGEDSLGEGIRDELNEMLQYLRSNDPSLIAVLVPNQGIGDEGFVHGARSLASNENVTAIDVSYNGMESQGCLTLVQQLAVSPCGNRALTSLRLSGNNIAGPAIEALCRWLCGRLSNAEHDDSQPDAAGDPSSQPPPPLQELYLYNCGLTDHDVLHLANMLQSNTSLQRLNIDGNPLLTNRSVLMLAKAMENNRSLYELAYPKAPLGVQYSQPHVDAIRTAIDQNTLIAEKRRATEQMREAKAIQRELQHEARRREADERKAAERAKVEEEIRQLEQLKQQEEAEIQRLEGEMELKLRSKAIQSEERSRARESELDRRAAEAAKWRLKLTGNGTLVKEWRNGFTILRMAPGQIAGVPTQTCEAPRRLKPCWCDPQDATAPFAKTLHYHCKHERVEARLDDATATSGAVGSGGAATVTSAPRHEGCRGSCHRCATVGFGGTKPLPDTSAAHFFASPHPINHAAATS